MYEDMDHLISNLLILSPERYESPVGKGKFGRSEFNTVRMFCVGAML